MNTHNTVTFGEPIMDCNSCIYVVLYYVPFPALLFSTRAGPECVLVTLHLIVLHSDYLRVKG